MRKPLTFKGMSRSAFGRSLTTAFLAASLAAGASACGGNDPLAMFYDSTVTPSLGLPFDATLTGSPIVDSFQPSVGRNGFEFRFNSFMTNQTIALLAPEAGIISSVTGNGTDGYTITIFHNARTSTRISPAQVVSVRVGDAVGRGASVGTVKQDFGASYLSFSVYLDGRAVCPSSFLNSDALEDMLNVWSASATHLCLN